MASHIFESLMDKLFSLSKETSSAKTLTGSRSFLGTSDNLLNNIPLEFYQSLFSGDDLAMNSSQESNTNINKLNSNDQSLVSQVSKFFHSPPIHSRNSLGLFHSYLNQSLESLENQILLAKSGAMSNHLENKICVSEVIDAIASAAKVPGQMNPLTNCFVNDSKKPSTVEKEIHIVDCIDMESSPIRKIPMSNSSVSISMPEKKNPIMSYSPEVGKTPEKENPIMSYSPKEVEKTPEKENPTSYSSKVEKTPEKKNPAAIESNSSQESSKVNKSLGKDFPIDAMVTKRQKRCRKKKSRPSTNITDNINQNTQESPVPVASPSKHYNCNVSLDKEIFNFSFDVESSPDKTVITMNNTKNSSPTMVVEVTEINHPKLDPQQIFNQESVNRKNKEIQKRSRKWRRRQHKKNKASANENKEPPSSSPVATPSKRFECDIVCDIVNMPESPDSGVKLLSSFVISVESACEEDDSEWDMGVTESLEDVSDLEFSGLFISNLSAFTINGFASNKRPASPIPSDDDPETYQLKILLRTVNNRWKETTKEIAATPKAPSKVTFAPDDVLVEAVEVEICERKGIWETYALERLRFKKRIDDLESIISPCLKKEHRQQIFKKLYPKLTL